MIYLHKILPTFVLPIMLVILVILIGLIKKKKKLIYIAIGVLYILSTPIFSNNFFKLVEGSEYRKPISAIESADAIVVLSGMLEINEVGDSTFPFSDRSVPPAVAFAGVAANFITRIGSGFPLISYPDVRRMSSGTNPSPLFRRF